MAMYTRCTSCRETMEQRSKELSLMGPCWMVCKEGRAEDRGKEGGGRRRIEGGEREGGNGGGEGKIDSDTGH